VYRKVIAEPKELIRITKFRIMRVRCWRELCQLGWNRKL